MRRSISFLSDTAPRCVVFADGELWCLLGPGTSEYTELSAHEAFGGAGVVVADGGHYHACALTTAGAAVCWGANYYWQLGNDAFDATGNRADQFTEQPFAVPTGGPAFSLDTEIDVGFGHSTFVDGTQRLWWGSTGSYLA